MISTARATRPVMGRDQKFVPMRAGLGVRGRSIDYSVRFIPSLTLLRLYRDGMETETEIAFFGCVTVLCV